MPALFDLSSDYPSGMVTFLFTDIEGYSSLEAEFGATIQPVLDAHNNLMRECAATHNGLEVRIIGDAFFLVFANASDAVRFALTAQQKITDHSWTVSAEDGASTPIEMRVRMGMHTGEARILRHPSGQLDYFGTSVNRAARVSSAGHGGQILLSEATRLLAELDSDSELSFKDLGRHRLKGVGEERLWQLCHPSLLSDFAPIVTLSPEKHNLPAPLTPFLGREQQLEDWISLLRQSSTRFLTIVGFGGMGKTRVALQIAELCVDDFRDGVWWVPLENVISGEEMIQRIAEQLIKNLKPQPTVREQLWNFHRDRELLLVLDNMEQIERRDAAQVIMALLNAAPGLKILATSRRSLEIAPERLVELEPFSASEAESLFLERAQARKANFLPEEQSTREISAICQRLEGVPLAIEIAASRIVLLSPRQILERLDDQLKLLVARDPNRPPRQQAVRGAVEWSYNLLDENARNLFAQLSVFAGGFTIEAAEAVVDDGDTTNVGFDVLDGLMELRNQSLLRTHVVPENDEDRLIMLEAVREFAAEKLTDLSAHRRHAEYFCRWAKEQAEALRTSQEAQVLSNVEIEFDNLRTAFSWTEKNDADLCARMAVVFHQPLHLRGHWEEAGNVLQKGWDKAQLLPASANALLLCAALRHHQACLMEDVGQLIEAKRFATEALNYYCEAEDQIGAANTLNLLMMLATELGELSDARQLGEEALKLWPETEYVGRAKTLHNLARLAQEQNPEAARQLYEESVALRRKVGDERGMATTLGNLGTLAQKAGDTATAREYYTQSLRLRNRLREPLGIAITLNNLGEVAVAENDFSLAITLFTHAERILTDLKSRYVSEPTEALSRLQTKLGPAEYFELRRRAEANSWQESVSLG